MKKAVVDEVKSERWAGARLCRALEATEGILDSVLIAVGSHVRCFEQNSVTCVKSLLAVMWGTDRRDKGGNQLGNYCSHP